MLRQRVLTSANGLPILALLLWLDYDLRQLGRQDYLPLLALVIVIAGASAWEAGSIIHARISCVSPWNAVYAAVILPFMTHAILLPGGNSGPGLLIDSLGATVAVMLLFLGIWSDIERERANGIRGNIYVLLWGAYLGIAATALLLIGCNTSLHEVGVVLVFASIFACDTSAYFGGKLIGGPLMAPKISPHKTFTGSVCGLAGAVLMAVLFHVLAQIDWWVLWIGFSIGIFGQLGDLVESAFKRWGDVKDSSQIIPGHGGFLDRFDSLFLAAPVAYVLLLEFLK